MCLIVTPNIAFFFLLHRFKKVKPPI